MTLRLAGTNSLQSAALTTPGAIDHFAHSLKRAGHLLYPPGKQFLEKIAYRVIKQNLRPIL